jgi:hypothetical protein
VTGRAAAIVLAALPAGAFAQTQVELTVGGGIGSSFTRRAPFVLDGLTYRGPYRTCPAGLPAGLCARGGSTVVAGVLYMLSGPRTDVAYALETHYSSVAVGGLQVRHGVGGPFLLGAGVLGGLALRNQRIQTIDTGTVVDGRPLLTQDLSNAAGSNASPSTNGVGVLTYLHAGLRWERGFESRTTIGYRPSGTRVFVEAAGGLLAALPGGGDAGIGHPPGFHVAGGLVFKRTRAHPLTLSLRYVQALGKRDNAMLVDSRQSWAVVQVGWLIH